MAQALPEQGAEKLENVDDEIWIRPSQPWEKWRRLDEVVPNTSGVPFQTSDNVDAPDNCSETSISCPEFHAFLIDLENRICESPQQSDVNSKILSDVSYMVNETFRRLGDKYPETFGGAIVHKVGSVGESTKIGLHDEFDFMVELPSLTREMLQNALPVAENKTNVIMVKEEFVMLLDTDVENEVIEIPLKSPSREGVIIKELLASLPPDWRINTSLRRGFSQQSFVMQVSLLFHPENAVSPVEVFWDISFCIPFLWTPDKRGIYCRSGTEADLVSDNQQYHLLINERHCYRTDVFREVDKLVHSRVSDGARRVYRLAKILTRDFLPPVYDVKRDRFGGPVESYWLKQILLYMIDEFPNPESWTDKHLSLRVTQLISKLHQCTTNWMVLSNYSQPELNHLDELPKSKRVEKEITYEYIPILHELLSKSFQGNKAALMSLKKLSDITIKFQGSIVHEAKLSRLNSMLYHYVKMVKRTPYEAPDFVVDIDKKDSLLDTLLLYAQMHLQGTIDMRKDESGLRITYKGEEFTLADYMEKHVNDRDMHVMFFFGFFYMEWSSSYDRLLGERLPEAAKLKRNG